MRFLLAVGSNYLRARSLRKAVKHLSPLVTVSAFSGLYASKDQDGGGDYLNLVADVTTSLPPEELKKLLKDTEKHIGRSKNSLKQCVLDLDILADNSGAGTGIHEDLQDKPYVIVPVCEVAGVAGYRRLTGDRGADPEQCRKFLRRRADPLQVRRYFSKYCSY